MQKVDKSAEIMAKTYEHIGRLSPEQRSHIDSSDRMIEDLGYTSIKVIELMIALEREFHLPPISEEEISRIATAGDVADLAVALVSGAR